MTPVLDYRSPATRNRVRPRRLLSHSRTAALLCLVTLAFDLKLIGLREQALQVSLLEMVLPICGAMAVVSSVWIGQLLPSDRALLWCCGLIYLVTLAWVVLAPSLN